MPSQLLFPVVYAALCVSGSQKGDNFWVMDRVLIGPFEITSIGQYLWIEKSQNNGLVTVSHFALCAQATFTSVGSYMYKAPVVQARQQQLCF